MSNLNNRTVALVGIIFVLAAFGGNIYGLLHVRSPARAKFAAASSSQRSPQVEDFFANAPATGNVVLRFHNFSVLDNHILGVTYFRSVYALYPRKVYATESTNVVNYARDLLAAPLNSSDEWLDEHSVTAIVDLKCIAGTAVRPQVTVRTKEGK